MKITEIIIYLKGKILTKPPVLLYNLDNQNEIFNHILPQKSFLSNLIIAKLNWHIRKNNYE